MKSGDIVYSTSEGFGIITAIQKRVCERSCFSDIHHVEFGTEGEKRLLFYDENGGRFDLKIDKESRVRELYRAVDYFNIPEKVKNRAKGTSIAVYTHVFDLAMGWGVVEYVNYTDGVFTVAFSHPGGFWKLSYNFNGTLASGKGSSKRVFTRKEMEAGELSNVLFSNLYKNHSAPTFESDEALDTITGHDGFIKNTSSKPMWLFFYQPTNSNGYCKNVMIGAAGGGNIKEAFESMGHQTNKEGKSRLDTLEILIARGLIHRIFAYRVAYPSVGDKSFLDCLTAAVHDAHASNNVDMVTILRRVTL